jgi:hypothetical protein
MTGVLVGVGKCSAKLAFVSDEHRGPAAILLEQGHYLRRRWLLRVLQAAVGLAI